MTSSAYTYTAARDPRSARTQTIVRRRPEAARWQEYT